MWWYHLCFRIRGLKFKLELTQPFNWQGGCWERIHAVICVVSVVCMQVCLNRVGFCTCHRIMVDGITPAQVSWFQKREECSGKGDSSTLLGQTLLCSGIILVLELGVPGSNLRAGTDSVLGTSIVKHLGYTAQVNGEAWSIHIIAEYEFNFLQRKIHLL